ncbi:MAG TPA: hypothetical protein VMT37_01430 [Solirubrobacterales bacterium]|nr:hypothetical protein [Solirubrobacterales bacterium]
MSDSRGRFAFGLVCFVSLLGLSLWQLAAQGSGASGGGGLVAEPSVGPPVETFLGASPLEAPGEVWATTSNSGDLRGRLARFTDAEGWEVLPGLVDAEGQPFESFEFDPNPGIGRTTPRGGVVVVGKTLVEGEESPRLFVRDPGGTPEEPPTPPPALLAPTGTFLKAGVKPLLAAQEGAAGATRAYVVRARAGINAQNVLSEVAGNWTGEPICIGTGPGPACNAPSLEFEALAIDASSGQAWLLGRGGEAGDGIELFQREPSGGVGGTPVWRQQPLGPPGSLGGRLGLEEPLGVPISPRLQGQPLTVTDAGLWFDFDLTVGGEEHDGTAYYDFAAGDVSSSWCDVQAPAGLCTRPLGAELPAGDGRSFAWPSGSGAEPFGQRVVTGLKQGAILSLAGTAFERISLAGGTAGAAQGAALSAPDQGWLGATPPLRLTRNPEPSKLQMWPIPFRRPLTAIAPEPGEPVGALGSEALAVGSSGQVARYVPGVGWEPQYLLSASGRRATPTLRGIAWPEPERAFAVGDNGAMWVWQKATELWEPDPAQPPNLVRGNFTGIAFDPGKPSRGYAVGKQGLLLRYGRTWTREALPAAVPAEANLTSIAFAGGEALVTWRYPVNVGGTIKTKGGVIANDGSGWRVDEGAAVALGAFGIPTRVAGLPDGGAVVAVDEGESQVIEREGPGAAWQPSAGGSVGHPVAVAAVREGGRVRAIVSVAVGTSGEGGGDEEQVNQQPAPGQPPLLTDPYTLPAGGLVVRQTGNGWRDEQRQAFPLPEAVSGRTAYDLPARPDPLLALLVSPDGSEGWAVGGETGSRVVFQREAVQTAAVMRYGASAAPPSNSSSAPIAADPGAVTFALGGDADCAGPCADLDGTGIAPDRWLRAAVASASGVAGVRAFLYTGPGVAEGGPNFSERLSATLSPTAFAREEQAYAGRLGSSAAIPAFATATESDVDRGESLSTFQSAFAGFAAPFGSATPPAAVQPISQAATGKGYYSFASQGNGGTVKVIVLDYSRPSLGEPQRCWLAQELAAAGAAATPAIVVGSRDLGRQAANSAEDSARVVPILVSGAFPAGCPATGAPAGASAYFFDFPSQNRTYSLTAGGRSIPSFGSGTLGYVKPPQVQERDFVGYGGYLLAAVAVSERNAATNVAPVSVKLIPVIGGLALNATDGTLLRRSRVALFEGLARRPLAGTECVGNGAPTFCDAARPDPYIPIPAECRGSKCATGIFPEYTFTSSEPDIADFVAPDPASLNPRNPLLVSEKPVLDPHSGLLCAFNAGTTTVTVSTGGLSYSQQVTVLAGSVQRPCGTTPLRNRTVSGAEETPTTPPGPAPAPVPTPIPTPVPPPPPVAPVTPKPVPPKVARPATPITPVPAPFVPVPVALAPLTPIVPPPPAPALPLTPPSGTSPVSATEPDEEEEEAYDTVASMVAVDHGAGPAVALPGGGPSSLPFLLLPFVLTAAVGGTIAMRPRRPRRRPAYQMNSTPRRYR